MATSPTVRIGIAFSMVILTGGAVAPQASADSGQTIVAVDDANNLLTFDSTTPGQIATKPITGLGAGESVVALDVRPTTGQLYAMVLTEGVVDDSGYLYRIDPATGAATPVSNFPFSTTLQSNTVYSIDFNPVVDRLRVVNNQNQNMRVNPDTGAIHAADMNLNNLSDFEYIVGLAHDRNVQGATLTTAFAIDADGNELVLIGGVNGSPSPNGGAITDIGPLGVVLAGVGHAGFDISGADGTAFASLNVGGFHSLYQVDLSMGSVTPRGAIGSGTTVIVDIAWLPTSPPTATCRGVAATQVGTAGIDQLAGTAGADVIASLEGNDTVKAMGSNDLVCLGPGNDTGVGGGGKDKVFGETGKDTLKGNGARDILNGGPKKDTCVGGPGTDKASACEDEKSIP